MKPSTVYICSKCDAQTPKWAGRCFECGEWGSLSESRISNQESRISNSNPPAGGQIPNSTVPALKPIALQEISLPKAPRLKTGINEFDRVLGGGIATGSVILLSGEPGIGKSTLLAQVCGKVASQIGAILYTSGEESAEQVHGRFSRIRAIGARIYFLHETDAATIAATITKELPMLAVIDSVNTLRGPGGKSGTPAEIKAAAGIICETAKTAGVPIILVGQVRKDGEVAGPKALEHLVDVVLTLEGDPQHSYRLLRADKNRFGNIDEVGVFANSESGLREVANPSSLFLTSNANPTPGMAITALLEGSRPILCEIQALANKTSWGYPVRRASGIDPRRLDMILAVLQKRAGFRLDYTDIHVNASGGLKIRETAADLALLLAISSACQNKAIPKDMVAIGEVGLSGEVRNIKDIERRLHEAQKLGFKYTIVPRSANIKPEKAVLAVDSVNEALEIIS